MTGPDFKLSRTGVNGILSFHPTQLGSVRFEDVWGIYGKMGKPIPSSSTKPHIYIKVRDRYIYISTLEHPT